MSEQAARGGVVVSREQFDRGYLRWGRRDGHAHAQHHAFVLIRWLDAERALVETPPAPPHWPTREVDGE